MTESIKATFEKRASISKKGKAFRWSEEPIRHLVGFSLAYLISWITGKVYYRTSRIFTGHEMTIPLPSGLDVFLTGIKPHDSEIRLTRFLFRTVKPDHIVFDIGAHLGYYSSVMAHLASSGRVYAFEPSNAMFPVLERNIRSFNNCTPEKMAVSDASGTAQLLELPARYSEYDSLVSESIDPGIKSLARSHEVKTTTVDAYCRTITGKSPKLIKIDVEGAELKVLNGSRGLIASAAPTMVIEVRKEQYDRLYAPVEDLAREVGYKVCAIDQEGELREIPDLRTHILNIELESDNFVLTRE